MKRIDIPIPNKQDPENIKKEVNEAKDNTALLKRIKEKYNNNDNNFTKEELIYLYDFYDEQTADEVVECEDILRKRNEYRDLATIFDCKMDQITDNMVDLLANPNKYVVFLGDIHMHSDVSITFPNLRCISGDVIYNPNSMQGTFDSIEFIGGSADFSSVETINTLFNLKFICCDANFESLKSAASLFSLRKIGGDANFQSLIDASGLKNLTTICSMAYFNNLINSKGLEKLAYIGGDAYFPRLTDATGLISLSQIDGGANFESLSSSKGLENLTYIKKAALFGSLIDKSGLKNYKASGKDYIKNSNDNDSFDILESLGAMENSEYLDDTAKKLVKQIKKLVIK